MDYFPEELILTTQYKLPNSLQHNYLVANLLQKINTPDLDSLKIDNSDQDLKDILELGMRYQCGGIDFVQTDGLNGERIYNLTFRDTESQTPLSVRLDFYSKDGVNRLDVVRIVSDESEPSPSGLISIIEGLNAERIQPTETKSFSKYSRPLPKKKPKGFLNKLFYYLAKGRT